MADAKISALTSATTPLAGTEVLPIVQSGATVKVSVANLTAGRAVAMAGGSFTDNITQGTAAKGVNFNANTPAAGMTSQLLNWYEEGVWTPSANVITFATATGSYVRIGNLVTATFLVIFPATADGNNAQVKGFPFTSAVTTAVALAYTSDISAEITAGTNLVFFTNAANTAYKTNVSLSTVTIKGTVSYKV